MLKKPGMILLAIGASGLLNSCHIEQKDVETISRTTDTLRIYQAGDRIEYYVTAVNLSTGTVDQGTLQVKWEATPSLINPIDSSISIPVLKETTTLSFTDNTDLDDIVIRYISQVNTTPPSANQGSIILHAIGDGTGTPTNPAYWPYDPINATTPNSSAPVLSPVIFDSPIAVGTPPNASIDFSMMQGCGSSGATCGTEIYNFTDNIAVDGDTFEITTELGKLTNLFKISFDGGNNPKGTLALSVLGDIRHACGDSTENMSHLGNMLIMPKIGIIQMTNICQVSNDLSRDMQYTIIINNNTNIPLS